jgi:hypothetical protein
MQAPLQSRSLFGLWTSSSAGSNDRYQTVLGSRDSHEWRFVKGLQTWFPSEFQGFSRLRDRHSGV